jgi:hypothetical protein
MEELVARWVAGRRAIQYGQNRRHVRGAICGTSRCACMLRFVAPNALCCRNFPAKIARLVEILALFVRKWELGGAGCKLSRTWSHEYVVCEDGERNIWMRKQWRVTFFFLKKRRRRKEKEQPCVHVCVLVGVLSICICSRQRWTWSSPEMHILRTSMCMLWQVLDDVHKRRSPCMLMHQPEERRTLPSTRSNSTVGTRQRARKKRRRYQRGLIDHGWLLPSYPILFKCTCHSYVRP